ncbi:MAG: hypothetical protein R3C97_11975 [Geminicoccaceae bacterium]
MSATTAPTPFTPRAVLALALCMADGGTAEEAVEASGIDPDLAEWLLDNWVFLLLLKILPMLTGHRRKPGNRPRTEKERSRIEKAAAPVLKLFSEEQSDGIFSITKHLRASRPVRGQRRRRKLRPRPKRWHSHRGRFQPERWPRLRRKPTSRRIPTRKHSAD